MKRTTIAALAAALSMLTVATAHAQIRITEWMYNGDEFFELTNVGTGPIDMTGWTYEDDSASSVSLSVFGVVHPSEKVLVTESDETTFRAAWGVPLSVEILGSNAVNLGRNDAIFIYDALHVLQDALDFGDQDFAGSIRTNDISGNPITPAALGANDPYQWKLSVVGDVYGSYASTGGHIANPGLYTIPEPSTVVLLVTGGLMMLFGRRLRNRVGLWRAA